MLIAGLALALAVYGGVVAGIWWSAGKEAGLLALSFLIALILIVIAAILVAQGLA